jgi:hypothetical protein
MPGGTKLNKIITTLTCWAEHNEEIYISLSHIFISNIIISYLQLNAVMVRKNKYFDFQRNQILGIAAEGNTSNKY